jgi:hydrogenase maturation protease
VIGMIVIGVGNEYRRDDGLGPWVIDRLRERGLPDALLDVSLGETTELIDLWNGADLAIVVDAITADVDSASRAASSTRPGRIHRLSVVNPPAERCRAAHGLDLGETVELARILGRLPDRLLLYVVEVTDINFGIGLSAEVGAAAARLVDEIIGEVAARSVP